MAMAVRTVFLMAIYPRIISAGRKWLAPKLRPNEDIVTPDRPSLATAEFDMHFLRFSILADAILTGGVSLVQRDWQLFVAAALLPFASGNAAAAKGIATELVPTEHRQEALSAMALVESLGNAATVGIFGVVYAALAGLGMPQMVFAVNGVG